MDDDDDVDISIKRIQNFKLAILEETGPVRAWITARASSSSLALTYKVQ